VKRRLALRKQIYRVSAVFKWGIAEGMCSGNPATSGALALPKMERAARYRKALPYAEVAGCIEAVKASGARATTKLALEVLASPRPDPAKRAKTADAFNNAIGAMTNMDPGAIDAARKPDRHKCT